MARAVVVMSLLLVALAGCTASLADVNALGRDLEAEGYDVAGVHHNTTNGHAVLAIQAVRPNEVPTEEDAEGIAEIAWQRFGGDIDELQVVVNAQPMLTATDEELTTRFGERPTEVRAESESGGSKGVYIIAIVAVVVVGAAVLLLSWLRGRRPPPPMAPPAYHHPPPPYAAPPPPSHPPQQPF